MEEVALTPRTIALDETDLAMMTFGTAAGGIQTLIIRHFSPPESNEKPIMEREFAKTAIVMGPLATAYGLLSLLDVIHDQNRYVATFMLGYGLNQIIDLTLAGITNYISGMEVSSPPIDQRFEIQALPRTYL